MFTSHRSSVARVSYYNRCLFSHFCQLTRALLPLPQSTPWGPSTFRETNTFITQQRTKTTSQGRARQLKVKLDGVALNCTFPDSLTTTRPLRNLQATYVTQGIYLCILRNLIALINTCSYIYLSLYQPCKKIFV